MDEIDAALDFKNVSIVANYIKERTKNAQFIIISLRLDIKFMNVSLKYLVHVVHKYQPYVSHLVHYYRSKLARKVHHCHVSRMELI